MRRPNRAAIHRDPEPLTPECIAETERFVPSKEPYLTEWLELHKEHLRALAAGRLSDACKLADEKYRLWWRSA